MDYRKPSDRKSMHARIVQELGMQIVSGRFKPDEKLPPEALLCEEYAVSRPVLREATRVLVAKGLVYSRGHASERWSRNGANGTCWIRMYCIG